MIARHSTSPVDSSTLATAAGPPRTDDGRQAIGAARVQQAVLGQGAGRDHPDHVAADDGLGPAPTLGLGGVLQLVADGDLEPARISLAR